MSDSNPTLFTHPFVTLYYFAIVVLHFLKDALKWLARVWYVVVIILLIAVAPRFIDG